jgi:hypothetical protein
VLAAGLWLYANWGTSGSTVIEGGTSQSEGATFSKQDIEDYFWQLKIEERMITHRIAEGLLLPVPECWRRRSICDLRKLNRMTEDELKRLKRIGKWHDLVRLCRNRWVRECGGAATREARRGIYQNYNKSSIYLLNYSVVNLDYQDGS